MMLSTHVSKRAITVAAIATLVAFGLSACNTISGAGQDIKSTGKAIERSAEDNK